MINYFDFVQVFLGIWLMTKKYISVPDYHFQITMSAVANHFCASCITSASIPLVLISANVNKASPAMAHIVLVRLPGLAH